jgi:hypothetical protein
MTNETSSFNGFRFSPNDWNKSNEEAKGMTEDAIWLEIKSDPTVRALFKPNPEFNNTDLNLAQIEYESAQIADKLNIPHARTEVIKYNGQIGVLSFNTKDPKYRYKDISEFTDAQGFPAPKYGTPMHTSGTSLQTIKQKYPQLERDTVDMLFLDCLIKNTDRHSENREVKVDDKGNTLSLCPLFDFDAALNPKTENNTCKVLYCDTDRLGTHFDIFEELCADYPEQIKNLLDKARLIPGLNEIAKSQLTRIN